MRGLLKPICTAVLAVVMGDGCLPRLAPDADQLETAYKAELTECVKKATSTKESCLCRREVDERWGICKWTAEEWPKIGRCEAECR